MVKNHLTRLGARFELRNVIADPAALAEFHRLGGRLPPLTVIDGVVVHGFQPTRLEELVLGPEDAD